MPTDEIKRILGLVALAPGGALIVLLANVQTCLTHLNRRHVQPVARLVGRAVSATPARTARRLHLHPSA
jgi:hypothetical protein